MKSHRAAFGTLLCTAIVLVGCDDKQPAPKPDTPAEVANQQKQGVDAAQSDLMARAQGLYDEVKEAIGKADLKTAQADVDQLNAIRSKLPTEWQAKIAEVTKMLGDAKGKLGGMSMPAMPK